MKWYFQQKYPDYPEEKFRLLGVAVVIRNKKFGANHKMMSVMAFIGIVGWMMLLVPDLHFLYKYLIPALGIAKYIAFLIMGIAMFFCMPIVLTRKIFKILIPSRCQSLIERLVMGLACVLSLVVSRSLM